MLNWIIGSNSSSRSLAFVLAFGAAIAISSGVCAKERPGRSVSAERGNRVAARECAGCHAIDRSGKSARPTAPPFREIRRRYSAKSLQREFEAISEVGHYEMRPKPISKADGEDLIAYIGSLGR
ncbi:MAG: cytochrome c family protein [Caulobacteraceae bacterium]|nr:cytochrome c family protein [Caulobacteraceae bacterium]